MSNDNPDARTGGGVFAIAAFTLWGAFPLYFAALASVPAVEILAYRTIWVLLSLLPVVLVLGWARRITRVFSDRRARRATLLATVLLSVNWLIFIWAITNGYVLQSSLGYYINPLLNILLGVVVLREPLRGMQRLAILVATAGVAVMVLGLGIFPWVSISLAVTFAVYGLVRKKSPVDTISGLFSETLIVAPVALVFLAWLWLGDSGSLDMGPVVDFSDLNLFFLVMASGVVTALPLALFTEAARRLPLSVLGFFQYITPTGHFILAVFVFEEPFTNWHLASFSLIWIALALYSSDAFRNRNRQILEPVT